MKTTFIKLVAASGIGAVVGGFMVLSLAPTQTSEDARVSNKMEAPTAVVQPVAAIDMKENEQLGMYTNLTPASEKGAESVVHITTQFTREEITYDPFMKLFYGEDAYQKRQRHGMASGSGVIVSPEGYIVTNNHVVQDANKISVSMDGNTYSASLIGTDPSTDLAVIKIKKKQLPYLEFADSDALRLGEWVLAVGNPLNLQTTVTAGIVSAKNRNIDLLAASFDPEKNVFPVESFIQTDAAVNSGNSGGALVNQRGELVGINTAIASGNGFYTGYSFAIPSNIVKKVAFDLIQFGEVKRVQLGVNIMDNNSEVAKANQLATDKGVVITGILPGGNASSGDLKTNDVILSVDSKAIKTYNQLQAELAVKQPGDMIRLGIMRGGNQKTIELMLVE